MLPELFRIVGFPVRSWGVLLLLGFVVGWWLMRRRAERFGIPKDKLVDLAVWMLAGGIVGARIGFVLLDWDHYSKNLIDIFKFTEGGMTSFGGYVMGLVGLWIWARINKVPVVNVLDLIAGPALIAIAIGRIGCFLNGCCYGGPCELPWAVHVDPEIGDDYLGHPAQLYESAISVVFALVIFGWEKRGNFRPGQLFSLALIFSGIARYLYEIFRIGISSEAYAFGMTLAQMVAILMTIIGIGIFVIAGKKQRNATV